VLFAFGRNSGLTRSRGVKFSLQTGISAGRVQVNQLQWRHSIDRSILDINQCMNGSFHASAVCNGENAAIVRSPLSLSDVEVSRSRPIAVFHLQIGTLRCGRVLMMATLRKKNENRHV
jgi:hypothetical protein